MTHRQLPPQYAVHFTEPGRIPAAHPQTDPLPTQVQTRVATTLAGAKSIQRALARRGYQIEGIYELLDVRPQSRSEEPMGCGQVHWEWGEEVLVSRAL